MQRGQLGDYREGVVEQGIKILQSLASKNSGKQSLQILESLAFTNPDEIMIALQVAGELVNKYPPEVLTLLDVYQGCTNLKVKQNIELLRTDAKYWSNRLTQEVSVKKDKPSEWTTIEFKRRDGTPVPNARYRIHWGTTKPQEGVVDSHGYILLSHTPSSKPHVWFPDYDSEGWQTFVRSSADL